jgi:hypothetical protein
MGSNYQPPELVQRSPTDSGLARQRQVFTATQKIFSGNIRMKQANLVTFDAWRDGLGGGTFNWPAHPFTLALVEARFVAGQQGVPAPDSATSNWLVPVAIEIVG